MYRPRVAVIGYGYWGPNIARNFFELDEADLVAVCDVLPERLELVQKRYPTVKTSLDVLEILKDPNIDAVAIATPVWTHFELAKRALQSEKHVLVSKPLTNCVREAEELVRLAEKNKRVLMVDHTFIYTGAVRKIKEIAESGDLGRIYYFDSTRINLGLFQRDVSVIWDLAPHDVSIMNYVLNVRPKSVIAVGACYVGAREEMAYIVVKMDDGVVAHINVSWLAPVKVRKTIIAGSKKMIIYDDTQVIEKVKVYDRGIEVLDGTEAIHRLLVQYRMGDVYAPKLDDTEALRTECLHFLDCIRDGTEPLTSGLAGLEVVRILEAASRSMEAGGREVYL